MEIGKKIQEARINAQLTQEQVADALGVSRQTISNWENERTYPDIKSIIQLSDLYKISLDYLLKEESMSSYVEFLEESTNVVKSKTRLGKLILVFGYLIVWLISVISFWFFMEPGEEMGYALMYIYFILPVITVVSSFVIGIFHYWGKYKWFALVPFGCMYMMDTYVTFDLASMVSKHKVIIPSVSFAIAGMVLSFIGMIVGHVIYKAISTKRT